MMSGARGHAPPSAGSGAERGAARNCQMARASSSESGRERNDAGPGRGERVERVAAAGEQVAEREDGQAEGAPLIAARGGARAHATAS